MRGGNGGLKRFGPGQASLIFPRRGISFGWWVRDREGPLVVCVRGRVQGFRGKVPGCGYYLEVSRGSFPGDRATGVAFGGWRDGESFAGAEEMNEE